MAGACAGSDEKPVRAVGDGCINASECADPLVCAYQRCHVQCVTTKDCSGIERCVGSAYPKLGVCLDDSCSRNSDCGQPLVCGRRGRCENQCGSSRDCLPGQVCAQGSCADVADVPDAATTPPTGTGDPCVHNTDCNAPLVCLAGTCSIECLGDRDCRDGEVCLETICRKNSSGTDTGPLSDSPVSFDAPPDAPSTWGAPCAFNSQCSPLVCRASSGRCDFECRGDVDCASDSGCVGGYCIVGRRGETGVDGGGLDATFDVGAETGKSCSLHADCDDGVYCNGLELCLSGHCRSTDGPCDSHSGCTKDTCTESTKSCTHTTLGPTDADGDGHLDKICGGDDCDDKDATTYLGAVERCDGRDNNCNGAIDDFAVAPRGPSIVVTPPTLRESIRIRPWAAPAAGSFVMVSENSITGSWKSFAQTVSGAGVVGVEKTLATAGVGALAGFATSPTIGLEMWNQASTQRVVAQINADSSLGTSSLLSTSATSGAMSAAWSGSHWLVAWNHSVSGSAFGQYAFVETDGTFTAVRNFPTADGTGFLGSAALPVSIAYNAGTYLLAYVDSVGTLRMFVLDSSGNRLVPPIDGTSGSSGYLLKVSAYGTGFIAFHGNAKALTVSTTGVLGKEVTLAHTNASQVDFDVDYPAVGVAALTDDLSVAFDYYPTGIEGAYERTIPTVVSAINSNYDRIAVAQSGGRWLHGFLAATADDKIHAQLFGCAP